MPVPPQRGLRPRGTPPAWNSAHEGPRRDTQREVVQILELFTAPGRSGDGQLATSRWRLTRPTAPPGILSTLDWHGQTPGEVRARFDATEASISLGNAPSRRQGCAGRGTCAQASTPKRQRVRPKGGRATAEHFGGGDSCLSPRPATPRSARVRDERGRPTPRSYSPPYSPPYSPALLHGPTPRHSLRVRARPRRSRRTAAGWGCSR